MHAARELAQLRIHALHGAEHVARVAQQSLTGCGGFDATPAAPDQCNPSSCSIAPMRLLIAEATIASRSAARSNVSLFADCNE